MIWEGFTGLEFMAIAGFIVVVAVVTWLVDLEGRFRRMQADLFWERQRSADERIQAHTEALSDPELDVELDKNLRAIRRNLT